MKAAFDLQRFLMKVKSKGRDVSGSFVEKSKRQIFLCLDRDWMFFLVHGKG